MVLRSRDEHLTVVLAKMAEQRNLSGNRPQYGAFAVLEPYAVKVASTVLRATPFKVLFNEAIFEHSRSGDLPACDGA